MTLADRIAGCILGTAVGDALGLPYEGLSPRRAARLLGPPDRQRFFFSHGMVSDDTEHTWMTAQALVVAGGDVERFRRDLARRLRWWLLGAPAGIGLATLRAIVKLWLGWSPEISGVFSAGNGPLMRAAILGAAIVDEGELRRFVRASTRLTHTDPKSEFGAFTVALIVRMQAESPRVDGRAYLDRLGASGKWSTDGLELVRRTIESAEAGESTEAFAQSLGLDRGVTGYVFHTLPVVLHAWLTQSHDYRAAITSVIRCGGDTDTTAAILGGMLGATLGRERIPQEWIIGLWVWPANEAALNRLGEQVAEGGDVSPVRLNPAATLVRNLFFAVVVLGIGFRRLLPPY